MSEMKWQDTAFIIAFVALLGYTIYCIVTIPALVTGGVATKSEQTYVKLLIMFWIIMIPFTGSFIFNKFKKIPENDAAQSPSTTNPLPVRDSEDKIRFCPSCGYKLDEDAKFCRSCGRKIK